MIALTRSKRMASAVDRAVMRKMVPLKMTIVETRSRPMKAALNHAEMLTRSPLRSRDACRLISRSS